MEPELESWGRPRRASWWRSQWTQFSPASRRHTVAILERCQLSNGQHSVCYVRYIALYKGRKVVLMNKTSAFSSQRLRLALLLSAGVACFLAPRGRTQST